MAQRSDAKLRGKILQIKVFDAKLRFALTAPLRSAILSDVKMDNLMVTLPKRVKMAEKSEASR